MSYFIGINKLFGIRSKFVCLERADYLELIDDPLADYIAGRTKPNYPMPAIPEVHQWDYSLWCLLNSIPPLTEEEWEREEDEWQDFLDRD